MRNFLGLAEVGIENRKKVLGFIGKALRSNFSRRFPRPTAWIAMFTGLGNIIGWK